MSGGVENSAGVAPVGQIKPALDWTQGLTSDQQLAKYWADRAKIQVDPVAANPTMFSGDGSGGEGGNTGATAANQFAGIQTDTARDEAFKKTLSPQDLANYLALSEQHSSNANHAANNGGIVSLLAPLAVAGAYGALGGATAGGGAEAAGSGVAGGSASTGNMALIESGLGTPGYGASSAGTIAAGDGLGGAAAGELANTGSDAHFYQPQSGGTGVQDLGNMGGAGSATLGSTGSSLTDLLKSGGSSLLQNPRLLTSLVAGLASGLGGSKGSGGGNGTNGGAVGQLPGLGNWSPVTQTGGGATPQAAQQAQPYQALANSGLGRFGAQANPYMPSSYTPATYQAPQYSGGK